jgi:electron transport complex protein RnfE
MCSNLLISLLRNIIPSKVRIPAYILIIATFVTVVDMTMKKFIPDLHATLGLYIPLIVVNCIIMARAESFANQNMPLPSVMVVWRGAWVYLSITLISIEREFLGGRVFRHDHPGLSSLRCPFSLSRGCLLVSFYDCLL